MRYLPVNYVLDSGAPCAFLKPNIKREELFFILAWGLSNLCTHILKTTINHTKNIQGKDFERLPYPFWVSEQQKSTAILKMQELIKVAQRGENIELKDKRISNLNEIFESTQFFDRKTQKKFLLQANCR